MECNGVLVRVDKEDIIDQLLPKTKEYYTEFRKCPVCEHIYWEGSHYEKMKTWNSIYLQNRKQPLFPKDPGTLQ